MSVAAAGLGSGCFVVGSRNFVEVLGAVGSGEAERPLDMALRRQSPQLLA